MNKVFREDAMHLIERIDLSPLEGKTVLVTGATGLIGKGIVFALQTWNEQRAKREIGILALVRDQEKAIRQLGEENLGLRYLVGDVCQVEIPDGAADYILHTAGQTSSLAFIQNPVETIQVTLDGTRNLLEYARRNPVKRFVFLSTMEVYGNPTTEEKIDEAHFSTLDSMDVRSCYPLSKRMCENLCVSYCSEYQVPAVVLRLTQTFGPGVRYEDRRVFAEFARCAIEKKDIILKTEGATKRQYLYTADAVRAMLTVLLRGENGQVYNVANQSSYCSIREMAELVAREIAHNEIAVRVELDDIRKYGYAPTLYMNLDTAKIEGLGWQADYDLKQMFERTIETMIR